MLQHKFYQQAPNEDATTKHRGLLSAADFDKLHNWPKERLNFAISTDVLNGFVSTAGVYKDIISSQNFTTAGANGRLLVFVQLAGISTYGPSNHQLLVRILLDGTTPYVLGGAVGLAAQYVGMPTGGVVEVPGLAAGTHTIQVQVTASFGATFYCRGLTNAPYEMARVQVLELAPA